MTTVTTEGLEWDARYANQSTAGSWGYMAPGTGTTAESAAHTALAAECSGSGMTRKAATVTYEEDDIAVWTAIFTNNTAAAIVVTEVAVFDASTGGHMLMRGLVTAKTVAVGATVTLVMKLRRAV